MNSSESGRKLNQAVNTTSKAVGGALSQAKGAFSNFWSAFTAPAVPATPITIQPSNELTDETIPSVADEVVVNEADEKKANGDRNQDHDSDLLKNDIKDKVTEIDDENSEVDIAKEAETFDSNGKNERGKAFNI